MYTAPKTSTIFVSILLLGNYFFNFPQQCDMVLLAGDLFHENKPSRRSMHKAMDIMKRYCMGPNPVAFQIVSNQKDNFRSNTNQAVNYEGNQCLIT